MNKQEFLDVLVKEGFNASFYNNGIPTVFVDKKEKIAKIESQIKSIMKNSGYDQSYGICLLPAVI